MPESSKVSNGQTSERKSWDEKQAPYSDPSKTAPPIFPIGNANQATRLPGDATSAPVNMAGPPAPLPNLAAFNLPPVSLMNNLSGLAANLMSGLMGTAGADMMGAMTASMGEGLPANMTSNHSSGLAGQIGSMQGSMAANMPGGMAANVTSGMPAAIPSGLAANIPGSMPGPMGGMPTAAGAVTGNVGGGMAAAMPSNIAANMPGAFGMVDAMGAPNMENTRNIAAGVVDRRLDDGGKVDRKNEGVPPGGARDAPRRAEESCCVELRGLSGAPTPRDVKDLFRGLRIFSGCIRVATSETGMKSVVVRFASKSDAREAIHGDYKVLRGDPIQVLPFPEDLFEQTELLVSPSAVPPNQGRTRAPDMVVAMKGLPYNASEQDVLQFFSGLNVVDILVEHDRSGRATGMAFVEFADKRDFDTAMNMQRRKIGSRYIELSVGSRDAMYAAREGHDIGPDGMPLNRRDEEPPAARGVGPDSAPEVGHGPLHGMDPAAPAHGVSRSLVPPGHTCISMLGLPNTVTDRDIADFFSVQGVIPRAIHIMLGANGVPTGHAFAEFTNHADCETAFMQDGASLGPHIIALKTIPYSEVAQALGGHHRPDGRPDGRPENRFDGRFPDRGGDGRPGRPGMWPEERFEPGPPGLPHRERDGPPKRPLLERSSRPPLFPEGGPRRGPLFPDHGGPLPDHVGPLDDRGGPHPDRGGPHPDRGGPYPGRGGPHPDRGGPHPERGRPLPDRGGPLPDREGPIPDRGGPPDERGGPHPDRGGPHPERGRPLPDRRGPIPDREGPIPDRGGPHPDRRGPLPDRGRPIPERGGPLLDRGGPMPERGGPLLDRGRPIPDRGGPLLDRGGPIPNRGGPLLDRGCPIPDRGGPIFDRGGPIPDRGGPLLDRGGPMPDRGGPLLDRGGPLLRAPRHEELPPRGMDSFGKPGCVITATNIPFRAGAEEIINFFQGFDLTKEDVMRRFNEMGHVTGDARIAFRTPRDAQEALAKYNNRPMQGRSISLSIL